MYLIYIYIYMYTYVCVYIYIYIYIHSPREGLRHLQEGDVDALVPVAYLPYFTSV